MRGVFWIIEDELKAFVFENGAKYGVAKSGNTFNQYDGHVPNLG